MFEEESLQGQHMKKLVGKKEGWKVSGGGQLKFATASGPEAQHSEK